MSYAKKDEDAEQAILKVDRTSVFQEGKSGFFCSIWLVLTRNSSAVQFLTHIAVTMSTTTRKDRITLVHRREVSHERGDLSVLRHLEALPEQGCLPSADGVPHHQGASSYSRGCHHGHKQYNEGHGRRKRHLVSSKRNTGLVQNY